MKRTVIVSVFPGCGKTWLYNNQPSESYCLDLDSSKFKKGDGWEKGYVDYIQSQVGKVDFIFVSQNEEVRRELHSRNIPFVVVAPRNYLPFDRRRQALIKQQWFGRFILRDNGHIRDLGSWLKCLDENFEEWTSEEHLRMFYPIEVITLTADQYLGNIIEGLYLRKESYYYYVARSADESKSMESFSD